MQYFKFYHNKAITGMSWYVAVLSYGNLIIILIVLFIPAFQCSLPVNHFVL